MIIRSRAPLRLGFAGGGTDVSPYCDLYGGFIMNATIDLYAYAFLKKRSDLKVRFEALDYDEAFEFTENELDCTPKSLNLHKGVYERMIRDYNNSAPIPLTLTTYCECPPGSGLGASSTLTVAMVQAFTELLKLPLGDYDVAQMAYQIERQDLKLAGGKQDQYAATFGGFNFMEFYANNRVIVNPLRIKSSVIAELEASLVLYYTGVSRDSANIIGEQSGNITSGNSVSVQAMHKVKDEAISMKEALLVGDIQRLGRVMKRGWEAKKQTAKKVSNPEIDRIYAMALEMGAYAGKVSGAGGGGFMILVANPLARPQLLAQLEKEKGKVFTARFTKEGARSWKTVKGPS